MKISIPYTKKRIEQGSNNKAIIFKIDEQWACILPIQNFGCKAFNIGYGVEENTGKKSIEGEGYISDSKKDILDIAKEYQEENEKENIYFNFYI